MRNRRRKNCAPASGARRVVGLRDSIRNSPFWESLAAVAFLRRGSATARALLLRFRVRNGFANPQASHRDSDGMK
jgi:hypothetical protein